MQLDRFSIVIQQERNMRQKRSFRAVQRKHTKRPVACIGQVMQCILGMENRIGVHRFGLIVCRFCYCRVLLVLAS